MKIIIAILDNLAVGPSREALIRAGVPGIITMPVNDECGEEQETPVEADPRPFFFRRRITPRPRRKNKRREDIPALQEVPAEEKIPRAEFLPKTMMVLVVMDEDADFIVRTLVGINEKLVTRAGKIYVCPGHQT